VETDVKKIISVSNSGPMLAPDRYSSRIPMYSPDFPQVCVRRYALKGFSIQHGKMREANIKFRAIDYITGWSKKGLGDVRFLIKRGLVTTVVDSKVIERSDWRRFAAILTKNGFECVEKNKRFLVYTRGKGGQSKKGS
jgi:hypothetical protein